MANGSISRKALAKGVAAGGIALASLGVLSAKDYKVPSESDGAGTEVSAVTSVEGLTLTPGTYQAVAAGISSDVLVTCTIDENGIVEMSADVSGETPGIGADIEDEMVSKVLEAQGTEIDGVAGATITSDAIKSAVASCIAQAAGLEEIWTQPEPAAYTPGLYTAKAAGIDSDVTVACTFDESGITNMMVDVSGETAGIGADIGDEMIQQFLAAQSSAVDGVAGATITSDALKAALDDCIAQASSGAAPAAEEGAAEIEAAETEGASAGEAAGTAAAAPSGSYTPGTYTASAQGMESDVTVTATFDESSITDVELDVSGETAGIGAETADPLKEQILAAQSAEIDGVAGATITSTAAKTALADILAQAAGGAGEAAAEEAETEAATEAGTEAAAEAAAGSYTPGTYTASAQGMESDVTVTATFDESSITDVELDVSGETAGIGAETADPLKEQILAAQSAEIDGVAGATITSTAAKTALADILAQAAGGAGEAAAGEAAEETETEAATEAAAEETETEAVTEAPAAIYTPGTYTATAKGMESDVTVTCTFSESALTAMEIDVSGETPGVGAEVGDKLMEQFLAEQTSDIGWIAGATVTSEAVKEAVADCFSQAGAEEGSEVSETSEEAETEAVTETVTELEPGTYAAAAKGMASEVAVKLIFGESSIEDIMIDVSGETDGIGAAIGTMMENRVLKAQSADVNGVSGATVTSDAIKEAVKEAIAQAEADGIVIVIPEETETEAAAETETEAAETEAESEIVTEEAETEADTEAVETVTYTATEKGLQSDVTVSCTFAQDELVQVTVDVSGETDGIGAAIGTMMENRAMKAGSAEIDGVSGATVTSDAVKAALASCFEQASGTAEEPETESLTESVAEAEESETEAETSTEA